MGVTSVSLCCQQAVKELALRDDTLRALADS